MFNRHIRRADQRAGAQRPGSRRSGGRLIASHRRPARWRQWTLFSTLIAVVLALPAFVRSAPEADAAAVPLVAPAPGTFSGLGFDACTAPSAAAMQAWRAHSPYRAAIIYFGGLNRGCAQPNLVPSWVADRQAEGWALVPIYVGLQAPCSQHYLDPAERIDPATAAAQGRAQADDAVAAALALGLPPASTLTFDMEAYPVPNAGCTAAVQTFMSAWTARLHDHGYFSGFYSSMNSGVADMIAKYTSPTFVRPDYLDFARWDGQATVLDPAIPATYWWPSRRMKQYVGPHTETHGGVSINIDNDILDVAPLPRTAFGDFTRNGWSDVIGRYPTTGALYLYTGNGTNWNARLTIGSGWNSMDVITRLGDFNRDGYEDIISRERATGYLWLYRGNGAGFFGRTRVGTGWNSMREITPIGDFNGDGYLDLLAVRTSTGQLFLYPGRGTAFGAAVAVGTGWNGYDELTGVGDFNRDGRPDLVARQKSTGYLYLYPRGGGAFGARSLISSGQSTKRNLVGIGDFDRDGYADIVSIDGSTFMLHRGTGTVLLAPKPINGGWGGIQPIA